MSNILLFENCHYSNISLVGGKSASLGELTRIPFVNNADGFAITTTFYTTFLKNNCIEEKIAEIYQTVTSSLSLRELTPVLQALIF